MAPATHRASGLRKAFEQEFFAVVPLIWFGTLLAVWITNDVVATDFHHYYWPAGNRLLHGETPYVHGPWFPAELPFGFVYPAPAAVLFTPVAAIPREIGDVLFTVLSLVVTFATLRLLDVRDWRCYGLVILWAPVTFGVQCANLSMPLTLAAAAMWRYRDRAATAGVLLGIAVAIKLFMFPLGLFFLVTKRFGAVAYGVGVAVGVTAISWLIVGLDDLSRYRAMVDDFTALLEDDGYSVIGLVERLGGGQSAAYATAIALAIAACLACIVLAVRRRERDAFILAVCASLLATPIMWLHYFALLLVPVGLASSRLSPLWALPALFWLGLASSHPSTLQVALALALTAYVVAAALRVEDRWRQPAPAAS